MYIYIYILGIIPKSRNFDLNMNIKEIQNSNFLFPFPVHVYRTILKKKALNKM